MASKTGAPLRLTLQVVNVEEYNSALGKIARATSVLYADLKLVNAQLKNNADDVELSKKKHELLNKAVEEAAKRQNLLTEEYEKFKAQAEDMRQWGDLNEAELKKLDEAELKHYKSMQAAATATEKAKYELNQYTGQIKAKAEEEAKHSKIMDKALEVEKEFNAVLDDLNLSMRENSAKLEIIDAKYGKNKDGVEALTEKDKILRAELEQQERALQGMQKEYEELDKQIKKAKNETGEMAEKHKEAGKKAHELSVAMVEQEAAIAKAREALKQNSEAIETNGQTSKKLGDNLRDMADKLGIMLPESATKYITALNKVDVATVALVGAAAKMVKGLVSCTLEASKTADELLTLSSTTGLTTDTLQEFKYASELIDVSMETLQGSLTKLTSNMSKAKSGTGDAADAFKALHVRITDANGQMRDAETVFYNVIDALGRVKNETERDALAMQIFGKSAKELNPLIEAGSKKLKELGVEAQNMGYVMSKDTLKDLGALDDAMQRFNNATEATKNQLALALLPVITAVVELVGKIPPKVTATIAIMLTVVTVVAAVAKAVQAVSGIVSAANPATMKTTAIILGVVAALTALLAVISALTGKSGEVERAMNSVGKSVGQMKNTVTQTQTRVPQYATGTDFHPGGWAMVGENGPEAVWMPRGSKVMTAGQTANALHTGGDTYNISINARDIREFNDIVRIAQNERRSMRMGAAMA